MEVIDTLALSLGAAWASGINLYAALFMLGFMHAGGYMELPPDLQVLADPVVLAAAGFMYCVEFFADKVPGVDNGWDSVHTFLRVPAGAVLAATAVGDVSMAAQVAAAIVEALRREEGPAPVSPAMPPRPADVRAYEALLKARAAATRRTIDGATPDGWVPEEKINVPEVVTAYTAGAAYACYMEDLLGDLQPG